MISTRPGLRLWQEAAKISYPTFQRNRLGLNPRPSNQS